MADEVIYFGRPGSLVTLPWPVGGIQATRERRVDEFELGGGGYRTGKLVGGKRVYTLSYESLDYETYATLEGFAQGHQGPGPFALLDPGRRNMLTVNQSGATSEVNDYDNFSVSGSGGSLASTAASGTFNRGPRALKWSFQFTSPSSALVTLDSPSPDWPGIPVYSRSHVFSFKAKGAGADAVVTLAASIVWLDSAGATLSTSTGSTAATNSSTWTSYSVVATPPANTVYALCQVTGTGSSISSGSILYLDEFQLEEGAAASAWRPGTGVLPLEVLELDDAMRHRWYDYRERPTLVLREVGP